MEAEVTRDFDVSHLSRTCEACGEFGRFVNTIVLDQFDALEADPPAELHWDRLDRPQKFMIAERLTRSDYSIDDFDVEIPDDPDDSDDSDGGDGDSAAGTDSDDPDDTAAETGSDDTADAEPAEVAADADDDPT